MKLGILWTLPVAAACAAQSVDCSSSNQQALVDCMSQRYALADQELNDAYQTLLSALDSRQSSQLRRTQRHWIEFRNQACDFAYEEVSPGREASLDRLLCLEEKSQMRTRLLAELVPPAGASEVLAELGMEADELVAGLRSSPRAATASWLSYMESHCSEVRVGTAYETMSLCIVNHRLVDK